MNCFLCVQALNNEGYKNEGISVEESAYLCSFLRLPLEGPNNDADYRTNFQNCPICENCKYKVMEAKDFMQKLEKLELEIRILRDDFYDNLKQVYFQKLTSNTSSHDDFSDKFREKIVQALQLVINVAPESTIIIDDEEFAYQIVEVCGTSSMDDDGGFQLENDEQDTHVNINSNTKDDEKYQNQDELLKLQPLTSSSSPYVSTSLSTKNESKYYSKASNLSRNKQQITSNTVPSTFSSPPHTRAKIDGDSNLQEMNFTLVDNDVEITRQKHGIINDVSVKVERISTESIIKNCDQSGKRTNNNKRSKLCKKSQTRIKGRLHCLFPNCIVTFRNEIIRRAHIRRFHADHNRTINSLQKKQKPIKQESSSPASPSYNPSNDDDNRKDNDLESDLQKASKPFSCTFKECSAKFFTKFRQESHLRRVHGQSSVGQMVCNVCNKSNFSSRRQFAHHVLYHQPRKYHCNICKKGFVRGPDLRRHEKIHAPRKKRTSHPFTSDSTPAEYTIHRTKFNCPHEGCESVYYEKFRLEVHNKKVHLGIENPYQCRFPDCSAELKTRCLYDEHLKNCHSHEVRPKVWKCKICPEHTEFSVRKLYDEHMEENHPLSSRKGNWSCSYCDEKFRTLDLRASHIKLIHADKKIGTRGPQENKDSEHEIHVCHICGIKKIGKKKLKDHLKYHGKKHSCPLCPDKTFSRAADLKRHSLIHSEERNAVCDRCGKSFKDPGYLRVHHRTCSVVDRKKFPCHIEGCTSVYSNESSLKIHLKEHDGSLQRTHQCDLCDFKAKWASTIMYHRRSHFPTKEFECHICQAKFKQKTSLNLHIDFKHLGKRGKSCTFAGCSYKAADKQSLSDHMRVHTKEKPFVCKICSRPFSKKCHLYRHERTQHLHAKESKESRKPGRPRKEFLSRICIEEQQPGEQEVEQKVAEYLVYALT